MLYSIDMNSTKNCCSCNQETEKWKDHDFVKYGA